MIYRLLLLLLFVGTTHAVDADLLTELGNRNKSISALEGAFVQQKHISVLPLPIQSSGTFRFSDQQGIEWVTLSPISQRLQLTASGITVGDQPLGGQTLGKQAPNHQPQAPAVIAKIFMGLISGELDSLNDYFEIEATGSIEQWQLSLKPISANLSVYIDTIIVSGAEYTDELTISERNGDTSHISFTISKIERNK